MIEKFTELIVPYAESIIYSALLFLLVLLEIWLINKGAKFLKRKIASRELTDFKIKSFELLNVSKQRLTIGGLITVIKTCLILTVIYVSLILLLKLFPGTEDIINKLVDFIYKPLKTALHGFVEYLPKLFSIVIVIIIFHYLKKLVKSVFGEIQKGQLKIDGFEPHWARITRSIIVFIINVLMLILIFPNLPGYDSLAFNGIAAFVGLLVTIGGSSVIANYMAGIVISYMNPCSIGDVVKIGETIGEVIEFSKFAIKVQTPKMVQVSIPNAKVLSSHLINFNGGRDNFRTILHTTVSISYDVSFEKVNELLIAAAKATKDIDQSPLPFVMQKKLDDFYVVYELNAYTSAVPKMFRIYSDMHKNILIQFKNEGIEILSPHVETTRDGNKTNSSGKM